MKIKLSKLERSRNRKREFKIIYDYFKTDNKYIIKTKLPFQLFWRTVCDDFGDVFKFLTEENADELICRILNFIELNNGE